MFTFEVPFKRRFAPTSWEVQYFLEIWNPWGKVMEISGVRLEHFCLEVVLYRQKKKKCLTDFALQNKVETSGQRAYRCYYTHQ